MNRKQKKGFTLVELLVVISIIGFLSSVVLASLNEARKKARDAVRLSDMHQIKLALQMYYDQYGYFPNSLPGQQPEDTGCSEPFYGGDWDLSSIDGDSDGKPFIEPLVDAGIFPKVPVDPINDATTANCSDGHGYVYYLKPTGYEDCPIARGKVYLLGITNMETSNGIHPASPRFMCDSDWYYQNYFEWFDGGFEK